MTATGECDGLHWHCPMCPRVYVISEHLLQARGELYANRALAYHRDEHIDDHCDEFATEMELADL